jgi:hypothetical protein
MLDDAVVLFGLLALYGLVVGSITALIWYLIHKD